ncbi:lipopolysaccharide heptosyltransferase II [Telmatocola sphagniphila]|uniref:lipopolysaccharide heptosyltransferase II n=1 Tax=Telmatocola sphagniphila TaxID=1123043 RepID=A0A8E6BAX8_9BACT|nr:lipopolysaccharide heptosyltransferase II [Telmatocola sphagniphila]QVL34679.1 lipopolysaccharide heptosyltransferase II [Telmatocola sphagniphila]
MKQNVPLTDYEAKRIAFIKPSALGDVVHALPVLEAVRIRYPSAEIVWVINKSYRALIENHPALNDVMPFDRGAMKKGLSTALSYSLQFAKELRKRRFDLALDLQGLLRSGLMARFTSATRRVGLSNAREGARNFYTDILPAPGLLEQHAVERNWIFAEALGVGRLPKKFRLSISPQNQQIIDSQLLAYPRPWIGLAPGSRWSTKCWPVEHYAELANRVHRRFGGTAFLFGGSEDTELARSLQSRLQGKCVNKIGSTNLPELAAFLNRMDSIVSNDSGPLHLAAALGRPVVAPYTCTKVELHGPFDQFERAVQTRVFCAGSYIRNCDRMICMDDLQPELLWNKLVKVLEAWQNISHSA